MTSLGFQRMRIQSQAYVKRQIAAYRQRLQTISGRVADKQATCRYSAHSMFLRCAVNPLGPCAECRDYESKM